MQTYCSGCKKHTDNICPKELIMIKNKDKIKQDKIKDKMKDKIK